MRARKTDKYRIDTYNGRVRVFINSSLMFSFCQLDLKGVYFYKDDINLYGLDIVMKDTTMEVYFKTKETWLEVNKLFSEKL